MAAARYIVTDIDIDKDQSLDRQEDRKIHTYISRKIDIYTDAQIYRYVH